jgi:periplasmic divalent cation tolerance protein
MPLTPRLVFVLAPSLDEARTLAKLLLDQRLAACVNLLPGVESHYRWKGRLETSAEVLLLIKSSSEQFGALRDLILAHHSYECPEIVALSPDEIAPAYRAWWEESCGET